MPKRKNEKRKEIQKGKWENSRKTGKNNTFSYVHFDKGTEQDTTGLISGTPLFT